MKIKHNHVLGNKGEKNKNNKTEGKVYFFNIQFRHRVERVESISFRALFLIKHQQIVFVNGYDI